MASLLHNIITNFISCRSRGHTQWEAQVSRGRQQLLQGSLVSAKGSAQPEKRLASCGCDKTVKVRYPLSALCSHMKIRNFTFPGRKVEAYNCQIHVCIFQGKSASTFWIRNNLLHCLQVTAVCIQRMLSATFSWAMQSVFWTMQTFSCVSGVEMVTGEGLAAGGF